MREPARLYQRWQVWHGRAISENYQGMDALLVRSTLVAVWDAARGLPSTLPPYYQAPRRRPEAAFPEGAALTQAVTQLNRWGYGWVVLHAARCPHSGLVRKQIDETLGPGTRSEDVSAWRLQIQAAVP